jgi:hypothetical protein
MANDNYKDIYKSMLTEANAKVGENLVIGGHFTGADDYEIKITDIWVNIGLNDTTTWIEYTYKKGSKSGKEKNTVQNFMKNIIKGE